MWNTVKDEVREVLWLASVVGVLSLLSVSMAVALAAIAVHA